MIASKLIDVAEGRSVILPAERKAVPIAPADLAKFTGAFTIAEQSTPIRFEIRDGALVFGQARRPLTYLGLENGHPLFWDASRDIEVEFVADTKGAIMSIIIRAGAETTGRRS